ncbi:MULTISPECIES: hypothetical protein [Nostocales]|uniref:Uncharacterized protein n=2 Tax=Nostocales TaxID=1161 RepID=A0ABW8WDN5_9CYAN
MQSAVNTLEQAILALTGLALPTHLNFGYDRQNPPMHQPFKQ